MLLRAVQVRLSAAGDSGEERTVEARVPEMLRRKGSGYDLS